MKIAVVGAGWAGMAAAVSAAQAGHQVSVFETSHTLGGRARMLTGHLPDGTEVLLDNGQHILIGAYRETLHLMELVGVSTQDSLLRLPLGLQFPNGHGITFPPWTAPLDIIAGLVSARGWTCKDKWSLLQAALQWRRQGYVCAPHTTVAQLCSALTPHVRKTFIDPLCISALNTPAARASAQVFLRVLHDTLMGARGASNLLLPRVDLTQLFPQAAAQWLVARGGEIRLGTPAKELSYLAHEGCASPAHTWQLNGETFDAVVWATAPSQASKFLAQCINSVPKKIAVPMASWLESAQALQSEAIATVYAYARHARLRSPMLALSNDTPDTPAHYVFDRGQLGGPAGLLAFVVSASTTPREQLQAQVLAQAHAQLGLHLEAVQTIVEKRATFACTPQLVRPTRYIAPGLWACGDYIAGPYPATLEAAVRSAIQAIAAIAAPEFAHDRPIQTPGTETAFSAH